MLRASQQYRHVAWMKQRFTVQGSMCEHYCEAALMQLPLPTVVVNIRTWEVLVGHDILYSLFNFFSDTRYIQRRIEETVLTVVEVDTDDSELLAKYLSCF